MSDVEQMIQDKGLTAPRITPEYIQSVIEEVVYKRITDTFIVCVIVTRNGFNVTGESACVSSENFDEDIGQYIAYKKAEDKLWNFEGYLLKERLHNKKFSK